MASVCIGPVPLALRVVLKEPLYGREEAQAVVGDDGVVSDAPLGELFVEGVDVGEQQVLVVVHELLLHGPVEALNMGVHLR